MDKREKLILDIMKEAEADGEPVTREEAEEMADMELKANANKGKTMSENKPKRKPREVKKDAEKIEIIKKLADFLLTNGYNDATIVNEQREITFGDYSVTLIKHRKKGE
jgi:hypothetical protein